MNLRPSGEENRYSFQKNKKKKEKERREKRSQTLQRLLPTQLETWLEPKRLKFKREFPIDGKRKCCSYNRRADVETSVEARTQNREREQNMARLVLPRFSPTRHVKVPVVFSSFLRTVFPVFFPPSTALPGIFRINTSSEDGVCVCGCVCV